MKRNATKITKKVTLLTDPQPVFNSIVGAGANGTPIRVIKSDELNQEAEMPKNLKNGNADIARLVFRGEKFKTEAEVQAWLDAGNYSDTTIETAEDGSFVVAGKADIADPQEIEIEDGVSAFVGEATEIVEDAPNADVVAVDGQKTEAPKTGAQKGEGEGDGGMSEAEALAFKDSTLTAEEWASLKQSTRDKYIGIAAQKIAETAPVQPVAAELIVTGTLTASTLTAGTADVVEEGPKAPEGDMPALLAKDEDGCYSIVAHKGTYEMRELTDVIQSLSWLKQDLEYSVFAGKGSTAVLASIKVAIKELGEALITATTDTVAQAAKSEDAPAAGEQASAGESHQDEVTAAAAAETDNQPAVEASKSSDDLSAILSAITGMNAKFDALSAEVKAVKDAAEQSAKKADTLEERLGKVEATPQTRKSADVEDLSRVSPIHRTEQPAQKSAKEVSAEVRAKSALSAMGMRTDY